MIANSSNRDLCCLNTAGYASKRETMACVLAACAVDTWNIPGIVRAKHGSTLCAVTSVGCPNPCFAPNRYT